MAVAKSLMIIRDLEKLKVHVPTECSGQPSAPTVDGSMSLHTQTVYFLNKP